MARSASAGPLGVCVVGAGAAGLCAARHLAARPTLFSFRVFEQAEGVGGTWMYTEDIGMDAIGLPVHSSMYAGLTTNIQQEIMGFPDFPFPAAKETSYPGHAVVLRYLDDYAAHFDVKRHIRFRTSVRAVRPAGAARDGGWQVTVYSHEAQREETHLFDAVLVCNGHYATPAVPDIQGIEAFRGTVLHSHDYRRPERFAGDVVALLGAAASGRDIALELARYATRVYLCHDGEPLASSLPSNIQQVAGISAATTTDFVLRDGIKIQANTLIYCTGYHYTFPFLSQECGIFVRGRRVRPLYKHIVNIERPTLGLIGIPFIVVPFPLFHYQIAFFLASLLDSSVLPDKETMYEEEEHEFQKRLQLGYPTRYAHKMAHLQWEYNDELADAAGIERLHSAYKELYNINTYQMMNFLTKYKERCYSEMFNDKVNSI